MTYQLRLNDRPTKAWLVGHQALVGLSVSLYWSVSKPWLSPSMVCSSISSYSLYINVFIFQLLILSLFHVCRHLTCCMSALCKSVRSHSSCLTYHRSNTQLSCNQWSVLGEWFGCCTHRLRRVCTGLRNTDITGAHGLVIHGFFPLYIWFYVPSARILKDFGEQARLVACVHPRVTRSVQNPLKSRRRRS